MSEEMSPRASGVDSYNGGKLSYKFQRLREQIRQAILSEEFKDRLPGERELGRRFRANAKTINKALCDLSSEGLLVRIIGRGTFVADKVGSDNSSVQPMTFHVISRYPHDEPEHRKTMLAALREALTQLGHRLELIPHETGDGNASIPASAWPASRRRVSAGLVLYPQEPQSEQNGHPSDGLLAEAWRRHIPVVLLAAASNGAKVNAVMPDYAAAGFSLAEHLYMLGCEKVVLLRARAEGREADIVTGGCQTAAMRHGRSVSQWIAEGSADRVSALPEDNSQNDGDGSANGKRKPRIGIVCVGRETMAAVRTNPTIADLVARGECVVTCVLEPGDKLGAEANVTSFEFDMGKIAGWAARLLTDYKPGQRPVEVIVPGELRVRGCLPERRTQTGSPPNGRRRKPHAEAATMLERAGVSGRLAEAVI